MPMDYHVFNRDNIAVCGFFAVDDLAARAIFIHRFFQSRDFLYLTRKSEPLYILASNQI